MLDTSARLLRLLSLFQARTTWSGTELAERLEVTTRTIRSDVDRLRSLGYPVHAARGAIGGYRLGAGASLPPLMLDDDEAVAVALGLRSAAAGAIAGIEETSLRALAKLEQILPTRLRSRINAVRTYVLSVPIDDPGPQLDAEILAVVAAACRDHAQLRFEYRAHDLTTSRRTVEPYRVVNWGQRWYLVAWDLERSDWRTFRVDRLDPRMPAGPRFVPRELPRNGDIAAYVSRRVSAAGWRYRARIIVHAPADEVVRRISPAVGVVEPVDEDTCLLDTGADRLETIAVYLSLLGVDFTVTEPPELVSYVRDLSDRYRRATPATT